VILKAEGSDGLQRTTGPDVCEKKKKKESAPSGMLRPDEQERRAEQRMCVEVNDRREMAK
jgi:hypothetical protein